MTPRAAAHGIKVNQCLRCGHYNVQRVLDPRVCSNCTSAYPDRPRKDGTLPVCTCTRQFCVTYRGEQLGRT